MADDWGPLFRTTSRSTTRPTPRVAWPTGSTTPDDVDDQAPIPLIVGIALALFIGFVIIVCCICRRRSLSGSSSNNNANHDSTANYQRAPTADGASGNGFNAGMGGNCYPMAPVNSMYPSSQGQQTPMPIHGQAGVQTGVVSMGQPQPPPPQHPYPSLPPNVYTPSFPLSNAPLPAYMPTSHSSHTSSASGPSSERGPSGFSSSPPAPAPAPTGMMAAVGVGGSDGQTAPMMVGSVPQPRPLGTDSGFEGAESGVTTTPACAVLTPGSSYVCQSQAGYSYAGQLGYPYNVNQGQGSMYGVQAQGMQGLSHPGFQGMMVGPGVGQGSGLGPHEAMAAVQGEGQGMYPPPMHPTVMDYMPGGGVVPRVGSPIPPAATTTMTELDHL